MLLFIVEPRSSELELTREDVFSKIREHIHLDFDEQLEILLDKLKKEGEIAFELQTTGRDCIKKSLYDMKRRWHLSKRHLKKFVQKNNNWLNATICLAVSDGYLFNKNLQCVYRFYVYVVFLLFFLMNNSFRYSFTSIRWLFYNCFVTKNFAMSYFQFPL